MRKLDCEVYSPGKRAADSRKQLEAIKNCELSDIDLFVREMVQNSLDAALDEDQAKAVSVSFAMTRFCADGFASILGNDPVKGTNFAKLLKSFLRNNHCPEQCLVVRDVGCVGMNGAVDDHRSRAWKLPFGFFDGQSADSVTGGANGVGKIVAFKFGLGFVVYYSKTSDGASRFVVAYMSDGVRNIFPLSALENNAAWWGAKNKKNKQEIVCCEDDTQIRAMLEIFGVKPYPRGKSGTTTIIPFFDAKACLGKIQAEYSPSDCPWSRSIESYLEFCVRQWYAPRCRSGVADVDIEKAGSGTPYHWGRSLRVITAKSHEYAAELMENRLFDLIKNLYDTAVGDIEPQPGVLRFECPMRRNAPKRGVSFTGSSIGWVAVTKINYMQGPYAGVLPVLSAMVPGKADEDEDFRNRISGRRGFMLYCRRHGMILSYEKDWDDTCFGSLPKPQDGEFYIGIFVVNSNSTVTASGILNDGHTASVDVVFRSFEKTDHYNWPRKATYCDLPIVQPILKHIRSRLAQEYKKDEGVGDREPLDRMSALLGRFLSSVGEGIGDGHTPVPEGSGGGLLGGSGAAGSGTGRGNGNGRGARRNSEALRVTQGQPQYAFKSGVTIVSIPITMQFTDKVHNAQVSCAVALEGSSGTLRVEDFNGNSSPVSVLGVDVCEGDDLLSDLEIAHNPKTASIDVMSDQKGTASIICRYGLTRKDAAIVIDCKAACCATEGSVS